MLQGRRMTRSHKGMRHGLSLLELLTAIVLMGILSGVGFKYYKVFYDTSFAAKQARIYMLIEQGQQLSGAHQLFETKNGLVPVQINDMVIDQQLAIKPPVMADVSSSGWLLKTYQTIGLYDSNTSDGNISIDQNRTSLTSLENDIAFVLPFDEVTTAEQTRLDFCNIINNTGKRSWRLDSLDGNYTATATSSWPGVMATSGLVNQDLFCYKATDGNYTAVFSVLIDTTN